MINKSTLDIQPESLPAFYVGEDSSVTLEATGGTEPYTFELSSGNLPQGLTLSSDGIISGTAEEEDDTTAFIKVTDQTGAHTTRAYDVQVMSSDEEDED